MGFKRKPRSFQRITQKISSPIVHAVKSIIFIFNIIFPLFIALSLSSCGSSKSTLATSSQTTGTTDSTSIADSNSLIADCNGMTNESLGLEFQLSSYYIPGTGKIAADLIRMNFSQLPSAVTTAEGQYLQIFRWYEDTPGQRNLNSSPVQFYFQSKITGKLINESEPQDRLSKAVIQNMIVLGKANGSSTGSSLTNFLQNHILILKDIALQYDALSVAVYDSGQGTSAIGWQDILIPSFYSNPATYASTHSATSLQQLHPNWNYQQYGWTEQDYFANTEKFCQKFF